VLTIAPPPPARIATISCFMHRNTPVISMTRRHSSSGNSAIGHWNESTPALLNAQSRRP